MQLLVTWFKTYRSDVSKDVSLEGAFDVRAVSLLLPDDVPPIGVGHNQASVQHRHLSQGWLRRGETRWDTISYYCEHIERVGGNSAKEVGR